MNSSLDSATSRARRVGLVLGFAALSLFFGSCKSQPKHVDSEPVSVQTRNESQPVPEWIGEPLSNEKLTHIETWLAGQAPGSKSYWVLEGELALYQGRIDLARRDTGEKVHDSAMLGRVRSARAELEKLTLVDEASPSQKKRAQSAIERADHLISGEVVKSGSSAPLGIPVIARASWGAMPSRPDLMTRNKGGWKKITVHHSAEAEPTPLDGTQSSSALALRTIQRSHLSSKMPPWGDIGYHFVIDPFGRVFQGRDLTWQGAHAKGDNNIQNLGICLLGNFDEEKPTKEALDSLRKLLDNLRRTYNIPRNEVHGHRDFKSTDCPGKFLEPWVVDYAKGK